MKNKKLILFLLIFFVLVLCLTACSVQTNIYTVIFDSNGGSYVESQNVRENRSAVEPTAPVREGYNFAGWYLDKNFTAQYDFRNIVTENIYLYAKWEEAVKVTITFPSATLATKGYVFKDSTGGFMLPTQVTKGSVVNFLVETSSTVYGELKVRVNGGLLTSTGKLSSNVYSFSFNAEKNSSVSAGIYYNVVFTSYTASGIDETVTRELEQDQTVNSYVETRTGEVFGGWFYTKGEEKLLATDLTIKTMATGPILELTGEYKYKTYTLKFEMNGGSYQGSVLPDQNITYGSYLSLNESIIKNENIFIGWYTENNGGGQKITSGNFNRDYENNSVVIIYAYFVRDHYSIAYQAASSEFSYNSNPQRVSFTNSGDATQFNLSILLNQTGVKVKFYYKIGSQGTEYREEVIVPSVQNVGENCVFNITLPAYPSENETINIYYEIYYSVTFHTDGGVNGDLSYDPVYIKKGSLLLSSGSSVNFDTENNQSISSLLSNLYKDKYTFSCWYLEEGKTTQLTQNYAIITPIDLYADFYYNFHIINYPSSDTSSLYYDKNLGTDKYYYFGVTPINEVSINKNSFNLTLSFTSNVAKVVIEVYKNQDSDIYYSSYYLIYGSNYGKTFEIPLNSERSNTFTVKVVVYYKVTLGNAQNIQIDCATNPQLVSDDGNRIINLGSSYYFYLKENEMINSATKTALNGIKKQYCNFINYTNDLAGLSSLDLDSFTCNGYCSIYPKFQDKIYSVVLPSASAEGYGTSEFYTLQGESSVRADAGQYLLKINLASKKCYYFEVSVNGTELGKYYYEDAQNGVLSVYQPITDSMVETLQFSIKVYLKAEFRLNGGYFENEPSAASGSSLIKVQNDLYYIVVNIGDGIDIEVQNYLVLSNVKRNLNGDILSSVGWCDDIECTNTVSIPDIVIGENLILYAKFNSEICFVSLPNENSAGYGEQNLFTVNGESQVVAGLGSYSFSLSLGQKECYLFRAYVNGEQIGDGFYTTDAEDGIINISFDLQNEILSYYITIQPLLKIDFELNGGFFVVEPDGENELVEDSGGNYYAVLDFNGTLSYTAKSTLSITNLKRTVGKQEQACLGWYDNAFLTGNSISFEGKTFNENSSFYAKFNEEPEDEVLIVSYGSGIESIKKGGQTFASGTIQITVSSDTNITESYLNTYLQNNGYTVNYAQGYTYGGWKIGDSVISSTGILASEIGTNTLTIFAEEIPVEYHTLNLPQGTNSQNPNYDANCGVEYNVVSSQNAAVGDANYLFTIKILKDDISEIDIYVNGTYATTLYELSLNGEKTYSIALASVKSEYTVTVKIYYSLILYTYGAVMTEIDGYYIPSTSEYYYMTLLKGTEIDNKLKFVIASNDYFGTPLFTKENYTFVGWYDNPSFSGSTFNFSSVSKINSKIELYLKMEAEQAEEIVFTVNFGSQIQNISKGGQTFASGTIQITVSSDTEITESYLNTYLQNNGYTVNYAQGYTYGGWKIGDSVISSTGILASEIGTNTLTIFAEEIPVEYHTLNLPQGTNSQNPNYDANCGVEYNVVSSQNAVVGDANYLFTIKILKDDVSKIEIYVNGTLENTVNEPLLNGEYNYSIALASVKSEYTVTVKIYYSLILYTYGAVMTEIDGYYIPSTSEYYYMTLEKGTEIDSILLYVIQNNNYFGNPLFTKENYTFVGWYDNPSFSGSTFNFSSLSKINSKIELYLKMEMQ